MTQLFKKERREWLRTGITSLVKIRYGAIEIFCVKQRFSGNIICLRPFFLTSHGLNKTGASFDQKVAAVHNCLKPKVLIHLYGTASTNFCLLTFACPHSWQGNFQLQILFSRNQRIMVLIYSLNWRDMCRYVQKKSKQKQKCQMHLCQTWLKWGTFPMTYLM